MNNRVYANFMYRRGFIYIKYSDLRRVKKCPEICIE